MAAAEQFITPQRMLELVEPFGIAFDVAEVPNLEWRDGSREWKFDQAIDYIFAEQYYRFTGAVRAATPGGTERQQRVWTAANELGHYAIGVRRSERVYEDIDEFASWLSGPFHSITIEGPANIEPIEGLVTKGALQQIRIAADQHRWDTHPVDSGTSIKAQFRLALPEQPKLEVREAGKEDALPLFVASVRPQSIEAESNIRVYDELLTATALATTILERLDTGKGRVVQPSKADVIPDQAIHQISV